MVKFSSVGDSIHVKHKIYSTARGHGDYKGQWEFPGGKIEPGETPEQAVLRECREELDVDLCVKGEFMRVLHSYPDIEIQLTVFRTAIIGSDPRCIEHKEIRFVYPSELADFELCPADITVAEKIISEAHLF